MPTKTSSVEDCDQRHVKEYIAQLSAQEKLVLDIATSHLQTSFDITKSIGYIEWLKNK